MYQKKSMASPPLSTSKKRRRNITCIVVTIATVLLVLILAFTILAYTIFKPKSPVATINSMSLKSFNLTLDAPIFSNVHLNLTFLVKLTVKNPNRVGTIKYTNGSSIVKYRDQVVGDALVPPGKLSAKRTQPIDVNMIVSADKILLSNFKDFSSDVVLSGTLPITTVTRISGKAYITKVLKFHVVSYTTCNISISVINMSISHWTCHSKF